jgi:hypothetical protein
MSSIRFAITNILAGVSAKAAGAAVTATASPMAALEINRVRDFIELPLC